MRYYMIAGEASGDLHGSNLIKAIKAKDNNAVIQCWGGDLMESAGGTLVKHYRDLAFMGLVEVLMNLRTILSNIKFCKKDIEAFQPDVLICIDYPGFNLRIAEWAKQKGIKVIYFIAPQVWAWKENRVPAMRKNIDRLLCILPFEKAYFKDRWNWDVDYVGHPLMQVLATQKNLPHPIPVIEGQNIIALLPGSRKQEILKKLPIPKDLAFTAGLLHDIGKVVLAQFFPKKVLDIRDELKHMESTFTEIEKKHFGYDHQEVGLKVLSAWNFPEELKEVVAYHHNPEEAKNFQLLTSVIHIANALTVISGIGFQGVMREV
jgi:putative nucleotidyltransferase with HDIG domain